MISNTWKNTYRDFKRNSSILPSSAATDDTQLNPIFTENERYDFFRNYPWIYDTKLYIEYRLYEKRFFTKVQCFPIAVLYCIGIMLQTRFLSNYGTIGVVSLILLITFGLLFLLFLLLNSPQLLSKFSYHNVLRVVVRRIQDSWIGGHIEDVMSVVLTMIFGFSLFTNELLGHVDNEVFLMYISPIICIICLRGVGLKAICLSYIIQVTLSYLTIYRHSFIFI
jgi:hypothetical protein